MRWFLLLLAVLSLACVGEVKKEVSVPVPSEQPPVSSPATPPVAEQPALPVSEAPKPPQENVSVRALLPATVMDYSNFTFRCGAGFCTGLYKTRLIGNNNSVQVDFYSKSERYLIRPMNCELESSRLSEAFKERIIIWCRSSNTPEKFSSSLWWYEPSFGYVSIVSDETTRMFSNATRAKNADTAANNTAQYVIGRVDYYRSSGKAIVVEEA